MRLMPMRHGADPPTSRSVSGWNSRSLASRASNVEYELLDLGMHRVQAGGDSLALAASLTPTLSRKRRPTRSLRRTRPGKLALEGEAGNV